MAKSSILLFSLLVAVVLAAVHSAEAVGEMGGYVDSGGGSYDGGSYDGGCYDDSGSTKTRHKTRRLGPPSESESTLFLTLFCFSLILFVAFKVYTYTKRTLMMVQVAIKNCTPEVQRCLVQTAEKWMDGERLSPEGADGILSDTISRILLHSDRCHSAASFMELIAFGNSWKRRFEKMCTEQREKSNGRIVEQSQVDEYLVVTVLVAATGVYKLPAVHCLADLKNAFSCLQSARGYTEAVKVFWTPSNGSSKILEDELLKEFPRLKPLESKCTHYTTLIINSKPQASVPVHVQ